MEKEILLEEIATTVFKGEFTQISDLCQKALEIGILPQDIINTLTQGMTRLVQTYRERGMYLDLLVGSAAAFQLGADMVNALTGELTTQKKGKIVLAVPDGPWTIGKDMVKAYLQADGFQVIDAGSDVTVSEIIEKVKEEKPDVLALGLYLVYRTHMVKEIVGKLLWLGLRHKIRIILSGPAVNEKMAAECGVDAYAKDAKDVLELCRRFSSELHSMTAKEKFLTLPRFYFSYGQIVAKDKLFLLLRFVQRKIYKLQLAIKYLLHPEISTRFKMTGRERILASLRGESDRVPLALFSMLFSARTAGIRYKDFATSGKAMAKAQIKLVKRFKVDLVTTSSDTTKIAQSCGAKAVYPEDEVPRFLEGALSIDKPMEEIEKDWKAFKSRPIEDYVYNPNGQIVQIIEAIKILRRELGDKVAIVGSTEGPFQGVALLFGANPFLLFLIKANPQLFKEMLDWYADFAFATAKAFKEAGADIIFTGESVAYYLSPQMFREFCYAPQKKLYTKIREELGMPVYIHSCGNATDCLVFAPEVNPGGIIQIDDTVDLSWAKKQIGEKITIMGNLDGNRLLASSSPWQVEKVCREYILKMGPGGKYWISSGCEVPRETPPENIDAMLWACLTAGKYPIKT